jgi:hydroxyacylglutathione hydrolase
MALAIHQFACLRDNYGFLLHVAGEGGRPGITACIDTPDPKAIDEALAETGWTLTHILNTHHHQDHAGGNLALKRRHDCTVTGPRAEAARIPGLDRAVGEGDVVDLGGHKARVLDLPGHTSGHIAYVLDEDGIAFVGDTLFAMGCGRLFEGTAEEMWRSLQKLMALADDTRVYCAHEYTQTNARFALTVEPGNADLRARAAEVDRLRAQGVPTVPTTIGLEKRTNPFLRPASPEIQKTLGLEGAGPVAVFAETRRRKDVFRG